MTPSLVGVLREALLLALLVAAPLLIGAVVGGLVASAIGAITQIQDPSIALVARAFGIGAAVVLFAPSIGTQLVAFTARLWPMIAAAGAPGTG